jgi:malonyl-CoA O-methyltransferase
LKRRYSSAQVVALDFAFPMLAAARQKQSWLRRFGRVCADAYALPVRDASVDWCISNLMLAWCEPLDAVLAEVRRVLKPGGLFTFSSLGPDSLRELRTAWSAVDRGAHVHRFIDMHDLGDAMVRNGFAEPVLDVERIVLTYDDPRKLISELKRAGFATATQSRVRHLGSRHFLQKLVNAYEPLRVNGKAPITFEIVYGQGWKGLDRPRGEEPAEFAIPLSKIGRRV